MLQKSESLIPVPAQPADGNPSKQRENFPIRWPSRCGKDYDVQSEEREFGAMPNLDIVEAVHQLDGNYKRVSGWLHIAQGPSTQPAGTISVKMAYAVSRKVDINSVKYAWSPSGITIGDPSFPDGFDGIRKGRACLGLSIVAYVAPGASLENLRVQSTHMGMQVHPGVNFAVTNHTAISLTTGTLDSVSFPSRSTHLETISGSISGKYALYDALTVATKSGSVNINVEPKEMANGGSETAAFKATSMSGSLRVDFERTAIPDRDYKVEVETTVGSVDGTFIHGSSSTFATIAGSVDADILPFRGGDHASLLSTLTTDGQTKIRLRAPYRDQGARLSKLVSTHKSISGILDLEYPQEWEGRVQGETVSGALHLQGKDLELIREEEKEGLNRVEARKGNDAGGTLMFSTTSGGCEIKVGTLEGS